MPGKSMSKGEEKLWEEARGIVEKKVSKDKKIKGKVPKKHIPWALVNHIFQSKKKHSKTASIHEATRLFLKKASEATQYSVEVTTKRMNGPYQKLLDILNGGVEGVLVFDPDSWANGDNPGVISVSGRSVPTEVDESPDGALSVKFSGTSSFDVEFHAYCFAKALWIQGNMGNGGHSFAVDFYPLREEDAGKRTRYGWDGDGSDSVDYKSLKVNGKDFDPENVDKVKAKEVKPA